MKRDSRLSFALHALLHLAQQPGVAMTSTEMAACSGTHPVVVRQTFAGLREAGIVTSRKGRGGGWRLARPPAEITLEQVQRALSERVVAVTPERVAGNPACLVRRVVHGALDDAVAEANRVLDRHLAGISLADLAGDVQQLTGRPFTMSPGPDLGG
ncbi:MAG: Rrf2 family transcriptional regulator [Thermomicrobiales bacterium]|nr:Rrf2 family transcriptional regulator [Thermomicrobiales bacterium]